VIAHRLVVLEPQVVAGKRLERLKVAERELDVDVQPAQAQHCGVAGVLAPAHGEHHDALLAAARRVNED
jgi:hypothetical protein